MVNVDREEIYKIIDKYGFTLAFAIIALLLFMGLLPSPLTDIARIVPQTHSLVEAMKSQHADGQKVLRSICLNVSKNDEQRSRCLE